MIETTMTKELLDKLLDFKAFLSFAVEFFPGWPDEEILKKTILDASVESYLEGRELLIELLSPLLVGATVRIEEDLSWTVAKEDVIENMQKDSGFNKDLEDLLNKAGING